jgi:WD40 repeat protein/serine/threonine protein kinase
MPLFADQYSVIIRPGDPRLCVSQYLALLEADLRATALVALSSWQQAHIPRDRWRSAAPNLLQAVAALQRPAFGHWNQTLYALRDALARAGKLSDAAQAEAVRPLEAILAWLREPVPDPLGDALRGIAPVLFYPKLKGPITRWDAIGVSICLRNRAYHDQPDDLSWWGRMAGLARQLAGALAKTPTCLDPRLLDLRNPWFFRGEDAWYAFGGIHGDEVVYTTPGRPDVRVSASTTDLIAAFQHVLGQTEIQQAAFRVLFARLAPEEMKGVLTGDFLLGPPVAEGGFAVVHRGYQLSTGRKVALKVFPGDLNPSKLALLKKEAANLGSFNTVEIVQALGFYEDVPWTSPREIDLNGEDWYRTFKKKSSPFKTFLAMEWVEGRNLSELSGLPPDEYPSDDMLTAWFGAAARALQVVHEKNLAHLDVTPNNLRVTPDGFIKLMDFGIARSETDRQDLMTQTRLGVGTPAYMAPEQFDDRGNRQSDVYGLCATFYELFTRRKLHDHDTTDPGTVLALKRNGTRPTAPRKIRPGLSWELETLLLAGLEAEPSVRPTARQLAEDLERIRANRPITYRRTPLSRRAGLWYRRNRRAANILAPVLAAALLVAAFFGISAYRRGQKVDELNVAVQTKEENRKAEEEKRKQSDTRAAKKEAEAVASKRLEQYQKYVADLRPIPSLWKDARIDLIGEILQRYVGLSDDPRGLEWYYWNRVIHARGQQWQAADRVTSLDWSPDGKTLYASDLTGQLTAWDRATGKTTVLLGPESRVMHVLAAPDGETLAFLSRPRVVGQRIELAINLLKDGKVTQSFPGTLLRLYETAAFSPDSKRLYAGTRLGRIPSFNLTSGRPSIDLVENPRSRRNPQAPGRLLDFHEGSVWSLAVSPDGETVASGGADGQIGLWSRTGTFLDWLRGHHGEVVSVAFSADGSKLVSRSVPPNNKPGNGEVIVWNLGNRSILRTIALRDRVSSFIVHTRDRVGVPGGNHRAEFIESDRRVAVGDGNMVRIWDYSTGEQKDELKGHAAPVVSLRACPRTGLLASADERGQVRIWNLAGSSPAAGGPASEERSLRGDEQGGVAAHAAEEVVQRLASPARHMSVPLHGGPLVILQDAGVSSGSRGIESPGVRKKITFHSPPDCKPVVPEKAVHDPYLGVACSPSGRFAATFGPYRAKVLVWDTATGKVFRTIETLRGERFASRDKSAYPQCLTFRSDDELYVAGESVLERVDIKTGTCKEVPSVSVGKPPRFDNDTLDVPSDAVMTMAFSPNGAWAVFGIADGDIYVYDAKTWDEVKHLRGHTRGVTSLAFTPDGKRLASCSGRYFWSQLVERNERPGEVILWDTLTWQSCLTLTRKEDHEFLGVGFANEGRTLYALANRIDPGSPRQPRGELIRWDTRGDFTDTVQLPGPPVKPEQSLGGTVLRSAVGHNYFQLTGYETIAVHPAGHLVAALTVTGQLVLWDAHTREVLREARTQESFEAPFGRMTFSSDGQRLIYARETHISVYSIPNLKLVDQRKREPFTSLVGGAVRSGDNRLFTLAVFHNKGEYRLVGGKTPLQRQIPRLSLTQFSQDAHYLLAVRQTAGGADQTSGEVRLLSVEDGKVLFTAPFTEQARACGFSGDGKTCYVLTVPESDAKKPRSSRARLQRWTVPTGEKQAVLTGLSYPCTLSPDFQYALTRSDSSHVHVVDLTTGQRSSQPIAVEPGNRGIVFFPDGRHFATFGARAQIHLWDLRRPGAAAGTILFRLRFLHRLAVTPDGKRIAYPTGNSKVTILDLETRAPAAGVPASEERSLRREQGGVAAHAAVTADCKTQGGIDRLSFSPDGQRLAVIASNLGHREVFSIDAVKGSAERIAPAGSAPPRAPWPASGVSYPAAQVILGDRLLYLRQHYGPSLPVGGPVRPPIGRPRRPPAKPVYRGPVIELCEGTKVLARIPIPGELPDRAAISPDGKHLAMIFQTGPAPSQGTPSTLSVILHAIPSGKQVSKTTYQGDTIGLPGEDFWFSADGSRLEFVCTRSARSEKPAKYRIVALDCPSGKEVWTASALKSPFFSISPDGALLARSDAEGRIVIERRQDHRIVARFDPEGDILLLQFVLGGRKLLSSGSDHAIRLWDVPSS